MPFTRAQLKELYKDPRLTPEERTEVFKLFREEVKNPTSPLPPKPSGLERSNTAIGNLGRVVELGGGFVPNPILRFPAVAVGGFMRGRSEMKDLPQIGKEIGTQLALEAVLPGVGKLKELPSFGPGFARAASRPGLGRFTGPAQGVLEHFQGGLQEMIPTATLGTSLRVGGLRGEQATKASKAFLTERSKGALGKALVPGEPGKLAKRMKEAGEVLEAAEVGSPAMVNPSKAVRSAYRNVKPRLFGRTGFSGLKEEAKASQKLFRADYPNRPFSMREAGKIAKAQQSESGRLIAQRAAGRTPGSPLPKPFAPDEMMSAERAKLMRIAQNQSDAKVGDANVTLTNLHRIGDAIAHMRGGGSPLGEITSMSARAGLGAGLGYALGGAQGGTIGGLVMGPGLNPYLLTNLGFGAGRVAGAAPSLLRITSLIQALNAQAAQKNKP